MTQKTLDRTHLLSIFCLVFILTGAVAKPDRGSFLLFVAREVMVKKKAQLAEW